MEDKKLEYQEPVLTVFQFEIPSIMTGGGSYDPGGNDGGFALDDYE